MPRRCGRGHPPIAGDETVTALPQLRCQDGLQHAHFVHGGGKALQFVRDRADVEEGEERPRRPGDHAYVHRMHLRLSLLQFFIRFRDPPRLTDL